MQHTGSHTLEPSERSRKHDDDQGQPPPRSGDSSTVSEAVPNDERTRDVPVEHGGPSGPEPTRYGDWERKGRCIDF